MPLHPFPSQLEILITNSYETTISYARNRLREHALLATIPAETMGFSFTDNARAHICIRYLELYDAHTHRVNSRSAGIWAADLDRS